jgi:hypothetical protein
MVSKNTSITKHTNNVIPRCDDGATCPQAKKNILPFGESIKYINRLAIRHRSASAALDHLIHEKMAESEKEQISAGIRRYYDSIDDTEREENRSWGEFAESQLPPE